jgi:GGDEF domain-containing protein
VKSDTTNTALAHRHQRQLAVLFLDVDRFKYINDTWAM